MPLANETDIARITQSMLGLHFTIEAAKKLKKRIDDLTGTRELCPCSECIGERLPVRVGHN